MKKIIRKLEKMQDKNVFFEFGHDQIKKIGNKIIIEFISVDKTNKLFEKSEKAISKYFSKKLKKECDAAKYCKNVYILTINKK